MLKHNFPDLRYLRKLFGYPTFWCKLAKNYLDVESEITGKSLRRKSNPKSSLLTCGNCLFQWKNRIVFLFFQTVKKSLVFGRKVSVLNFRSNKEKTVLIYFQPKLHIMKNALTPPLPAKEKTK